MSTPTALVFALALTALPSAGCRQADGPLPTDVHDLDNRLNELAADLRNLANDEPGAAQEFTQDLHGFVDADQKPEAKGAVDNLAADIVRALPKGDVRADAQRALAEQLWIVTAGRQLSEKQVQDTLANLQSALKGLGVDDADTGTIVAHATDVQARVTDRRRRWYEPF